MLATTVVVLLVTAFAVVAAAAGWVVRRLWAGTAGSGGDTDGQEA